MDAARLTLILDCHLMMGFQIVRTGQKTQVNRHVKALLGILSMLPQAINLKRVSISQFPLPESPWNSEGPTTARLPLMAPWAMDGHIPMMCLSVSFKRAR